MTCDIATDDLDWCWRGARTLTDGEDYVPPEPDRPFVYRQTSILRSGARLEDAIGGSIPWGAGGFTISLPASGVVSRELRLTGGRKAFEQLLPSALLHELVHYRQFRHVGHAGDTAPAKLADDEPGTLLANYYTDPRELEAHAAQIAFLLGPCDADGDTTEDDVFGQTEVGRRIEGRLGPLTEELLDEQCAGFRASLTELVGEWRERLWPPEAATPAV